MLKNGSPDADTGVIVRRAAVFVVMTFGVSLAVWLPIIASQRDWIGVEIPVSLATLGIFGPAIAALLLRLATDGRAGLRTVWADAVRWRFGRRWWMATLLAPPSIIGGTYTTYLFLGGDVQTASTVAMLRDAGTFGVIIVPALILVTVVLAFGEEAGWRGYLLPLLQTRLSALSASLIVGAVWFLWHIPLLYLPEQETGPEAFPIVLFGATVILTSILYTWLYNNTEGSVLSVTLLHAGLNVWGPLVALHPAETGEIFSAYVLTVGWAVITIGLVVLFGGKTLSRNRDRPMLLVRKRG